MSKMDVNALKNEVSKSYYATLFLIIILSALSYYAFVMINTGYIINISPEILKIIEYIFEGLIVIQLFAVYNIINKVIFVPDVVKKISLGIAQSDNKLLKTYNPEEVTVITGCSMIFGQYFALVIYGIVLSLFNAKAALIMNFYLMAILFMSISFVYINYKIRITQWN